MGSDSVERDEEGNFVKQYGDRRDPVDQQVKNFSLRDPFTLSSREKVANEIDASEDFTENYIAHHRIIDYSQSDGIIITEEVEDAVSVKSYLETADSEEVADIGSSLGHLIADIHRFGTHGDPSLGNFMYRDGDIISIDHEFYSENPTEKDIIDDIRIIESDTRCFSSEKYETFIESFKEGYEEELEQETSYHSSNPADIDYPKLNTSDTYIIALDGLIRTFNEESEESGGLDNVWNVVRNTLGD